MDGLRAYVRDVARATNLPLRLVERKRKDSVERVEYVVRVAGYDLSPEGEGRGVISSQLPRREMFAWLHGVMAAQNLLNDGQLGSADKQERS